MQDALVEFILEQCSQPYPNNTTKLNTTTTSNSSIHSNNNNNNSNNNNIELSIERREELAHEIINKLSFPQPSKELWEHYFNSSSDEYDELTN